MDAKVDVLWSQVQWRYPRLNGEAFHESVSSPECFEKQNGKYVNKITSLSMPRSRHVSNPQEKGKYVLSMEQTYFKSRRMIVIVF